MITRTHIATQGIVSMHRYDLPNSHWCYEVSDGRTYSRFKVYADAAGHMATVLASFDD